MNGMDKEYNSRSYTAYWLELAEKYFDATATPEEEKALASFLATEESNRPEFDEVKAVMGYIATARKKEHGRKQSTRRANRKRGLAWMSTAAAITIAAFIGVNMVHRERALENPASTGAKKEASSTCIAYIGGRQYTDEETALRSMRSTMTKVCRGTNGNTVEKQLSSILCTE